MSSWLLKLENFGGFKKSREFLIKEGLNLIVGENASGKTTIINSFKLLNKVNLRNAQKEDNSDGLSTYKDFLNLKTKSGKIQLINDHKTYELVITSPVVDITSFLDGKPVVKSKKQQLISNDPNVIKFAYIDKDNELMESIEYSGTIELIKNEIVKISNIKNYELILKHVKKLNLEYIEGREAELKKLNDDRKEIELKIRDNLKKSQNLEKELNQIQLDEGLSAELTQLKANLETKNNKYNTIRLKELDGLNEARNKVIANIAKDNKNFQSLKSTKSELDDFIQLEDSIKKNEERIQEFDELINKLGEDKHELSITKRIKDSQIRFLQETLDNKEDTELCQHCLNPIDIKKINKKLEEINKERIELNNRIRDFNSKIQNLNKKRTKLNSLIINQKNVPKQISDLSSKIENLERKIVTNNTKKGELEKEIAQKNKKLNNIQGEITQIQKMIINLSDQDEDVKLKHTELITKLNLIKEENDNLSQEKAGLIQKILILPENYNQLIERTNQFVSSLNKTIETFYFEFIDYINSQLKALLENLKWKFQEVYIDDDLTLVIKDVNGKPQKFHSLSDFEKKSIAILIILIIKMKYYPDYPIVAIDEHLNSADSQRFLSFVPFLYENLLKTNVKFLIITLLPNDLDASFLETLEKNQYENLIIYSKH